MHSRVFILGSKKEVESGAFGIPPEEEVVEAISDADSARKSGNFEEDIRWFKDVYGEGTIAGAEKFLIDGTNEIIGYRINKEILKQSLEKNFDRIIEDIKGELGRDLSSGEAKATLLDNIFYKINSRRFHFYKPDYGFFGERDLYRILSGSEDELYIISSFDYHF